MKKVRKQVKRKSKKKSIKNKKIQKYLGITLLASSLALGGAVLYEDSVDHEYEYCQFNKIFGLEHQANAINRTKSGSYCKAVYIPENYLFEPIEGHEYPTYKGQHVVEFVKYKDMFEPIDGNRNFSVIDGKIVDSQVAGERVEFYTNNANEKKQLVRVFK